MSEVRAIAKSISGWIINHSRMWADGPAVYEANFTALQSARRRKRTEKKQAEIEQIMEGWDHA